MQTSSITVQGRTIPVRAANTIVVGAGAAGMNAAVRLVEFWRHKGVAEPASRVAVVSRGIALGASRMSGSDKQTYYKMGTSPVTPDTAADFAATLTAGGCCHGDTALIEGLCSLRGFYHLVDVGVPFPHDAIGTFIGYKTDHDPAQRATSAGPKTSRFMSECLQRKAERYGIEMVDGLEPVRFVRDGERIVAMICLDRSRLADDDSGLTVLVAANWVLAAGGAGEIYATTVYPRGQIGLHGVALEAGLEAVNLTESQYGLASTKFRWNVSGTYMQVIPRIFSTDPCGGDEREFLTEYFDSTAEMAGNIFLKGYQWPFDAQRITGHQSSLIDMAVHQETVVRGRRVWMDFLRNPVGAEGWEDFSIADLPEEARQYVVKAGAVQELPIQRLEHMNRPAIDIYAENGIDLHAEPLEIAVCAQHHNGGFAVNTWWESNVRGVFVIGEMAGTHGVKRPGGSALNAGQAGGLRAAEYIANARPADVPGAADAAEVIADAAEKVLADIRELRASVSDVTPDAALDEIRTRMTRCGAHLRSGPAATRACEEALAQLRSLREKGMKVESPGQIVAAIQARQQCLTHAAMLFAIREMIARGAGSRGGHCVLDAEGQEMHPALIDPETGAPYRVKPENVALRDHILTVRYTGEGAEPFAGRDERPRKAQIPDAAFETAWREYREGSIYKA
ncbi:MAG TPA: FAD-binding protein [Phycisphaerae bacterium]|nr:FAD-binding protein [Phycisphaerae bacterium]